MDRSFELRGEDYAWEDVDWLMRSKLYRPVSEIGETGSYLSCAVNSLHELIEKDRLGGYDIDEEGRLFKIFSYPSSWGGWSFDRTVISYESRTKIALTSEYEVRYEILNRDQLLYGSYYGLNQKEDGSLYGIVKHEMLAQNLENRDAMGALEGATGLRIYDVDELMNHITHMHAILDNPHEVE